MQANWQAHVHLQESFAQRVPRQCIVIIIKLILSRNKEIISEILILKKEKLRKKDKIWR